MKKVKKVKDINSCKHRLVTEYDRCSSPAVASVLKGNYKQMVMRNQRLGRIFREPPRPGFKRDKNLKELLCRARLAPASGSEERGGKQDATKA